MWHQDPQTKNWNSGWIIEKAKEPNSFHIESEEGATYRRNRNFLKPKQVPRLDTTKNDYSNLGWSGNFNSTATLLDENTSTPQSA